MATTSGKQPGRPQDPTTLSILPGSESLPRQIGIFPAFRAALLEDAARQPALAAGWRGREVQELGVMLFEMWAYICDVLSFYDQFNANESYLRTALRVAATRRLIHLLGYVPRPAVAASADLALTLSGRLPVTVPQGAAFRSGAFTGSDGTEEKPQVFTALNAATVHPFVDKFSLNAQPAASFGSGVGSTSITKIYLKPQGATLLEGDAFLIRRATDAQTYAAMADTIEPITGEEGTDLIEVTLKRAISLPATLNFAGVRVERATQTAKLFNLTSISGNPAIFTASGSTLRVLLSSLNETIKIGDRIIFSYALPNTTPLWYTVTGVASKSVNFSPAVTVTVETDDGDSSITTPALKMPVTELSINLGYTPDVFAMALINAAAPWITIHHAIVKAGTPTGTTRTTIGAGDVLKVNEKVEVPPDEYEPTNFIVKDYDERAVSVTGSLKADGTLDVDPASAWTGELKPPLTLYGALVRVTRGEQVSGELLGVGDGSTPNQQFKLKKKPLTYVNAPSSANASGVASTLEVYVDNVRWSEAPVFYGADSDDRIYTVRQNEDGDSLITFGDGERGARLTAGARVTANYVFGAGAAAPPASSITQPVKAIKGVVAATNPLPAFGGAAEEDDALIKQYAPRSALMLGRAVSLVDYEAVAAATSGVRGSPPSTGAGARRSSARWCRSGTSRPPKTRASTRWDR
ncbi:MAG: hypothetical protein IPK19_00910 [Chloroflexi bacterium]|nr:hypothetical protein [Chloroflexota bacterium]